MDELVVGYKKNKDSWLDKIVYIIRCWQAYGGNLRAGMEAVAILERKLGVKRV